MNFSKAYKLLLESDAKRISMGIKRAAWPEGVYLANTIGHLCLMSPLSLKIWVPTQEELEAKDWLAKPIVNAESEGTNTEEPKDNAESLYNWLADPALHIYSEDTDESTERVVGKEKPANTGKPASKEKLVDNSQPTMDSIQKEIEELIQEANALGKSPDTQIGISKHEDDFSDPETKQYIDLIRKIMQAKDKLAKQNSTKIIIVPLSQWKDTPRDPYPLDVEPYWSRSACDFPFWDITKLFS